MPPAASLGWCIARRTVPIVRAGRRLRGSEKARFLCLRLVANCGEVRVVGIKPREDPLFQGGQDADDWARAVEALQEQHLVE